MNKFNALPTNGLLPRDTTRVSHLTEQTGADGRGVTIAVLDTGVDPRAAGCLQTSDGQRKIVDLVDCTSSGDVVTVDRISLSSDSTLTGLSGRILQVPQTVVNLNPSKVFRVGLKQAYDFFPTNLIRRLRRERREVWDRSQKPIVADARLHLARLREENASTSKINEAEARLSFLLSTEKHYKDTGPIFDCVVFHDGENWRAIVDTSQCGRLDQCDILENFAINGATSQFKDGTMLNFAVNIYDNGDLLSIVVDCGSHGTHVAGILAANFPETPHLNGLAPGAQIVSLKIGDSRLSSMETHQGLVRALAYCLERSPKRKLAKLRQNEHISSTTVAQEQPDASEPATLEQVAYGSESVSGTSEPDGKDNDSMLYELKNQNSSFKKKSQHPFTIDVVNMSFGEHSRDVDKGRFVDLVNRLVREENVVFVSSAGNDGPGLCSVSAPGGTTSSIIGVGAYFTPDMVTQAYSYLESEYGHSFSEVALNPVVLANTSEVKSWKDDGKSNRVESSQKNVVVGTPYTWSARGCSSNGGIGVTIGAPGGAWAPVPQWDLRKKKLMNGTSMSSPSAAGAIAVILSHLKSKGIPYTSALVRRAVENTALPLEAIHGRSGSDIASDDQMKFSTGNVSHEYRDLAFALGRGSIDALAAFQYIEKYMSYRKLSFDFSSPGGSLNDESSHNLDSLSFDDEKYKKNSPENLASDYSGPLQNCGDSTLHLEDWHFQISVEDGNSKETAKSVGLGSMGATNGIFLRGFADTEKVSRVLVTINIVGYDEANLASKKALSEMEVHLRLTCTVPWIQIPRSVVFMGTGRSFHVVVDPTGLAPGHAYFAEVLAYVSHQSGESIRSGPVFRVPISIHKPEPLVGGVMIRPLENMSFTPGMVFRRFYEAPQGATFALLRVTAGKSFVSPSDFIPSVNDTKVSKDRGTDLEIEAEKSKCLSSKACLADGQNGPQDITNTSSKDDEIRFGDSKFLQDTQSHHGKDHHHSRLNDENAVSKSGHVRHFEAHIVQLLPQLHCGETESRRYMSLQPGAVRENIVRLKSSCVFELCLAQLWSSAGRSKLSKVELMFGGLIPSPSVLHFTTGALCSPRVEVVSLLPSSLHFGVAAQSVSSYCPRASLTHVQKILLPKKAILRVLGARDALADVGKTFQLRLEYAFEIVELCTVKLLFSGVNRMVYDAEIEGGPFVIVHDQNGRYLYSSDIYPRGESLPKGEYTATAYVRHESTEVLENLRQMPMTVQCELKSEIGLDAYETAHAACLEDRKREVTRTVINLDRGERRAIFFSTPKRSTLPKWVNVGDVLVGSMLVDKLITGTNVNQRRGSELPSYEIILTVGANTATSSSTAAKGNGKTTDGQHQGTSSTSDTKKQEGKSQECKGNDPNETDDDQWIEEALKKLWVRRLRSALTDRKKPEFSSKLFECAQKKYPDDIEMLMMRLEWADIEACQLFGEPRGITNVRKFVQTVGSSADYIVEKLDAVAIAAHFGCNIDPDDNPAGEIREKFEKKRQQLVECLFRKARSLSLLISYFCFDSTRGRKLDVDSSKQKEEVDSKSKSIDGAESNPSSVTGKSCNGDVGDSEEINDENTDEHFEKAVKDLLKWVTLDGKGCLPGAPSQGTSAGSVSNEELAMLGVIRETRRERYGNALRILDNFYGLGAAKRLESKRAVLLREKILYLLNWKHLAEREELNLITRFPKQRMTF